MGYIVDLTVILDALFSTPGNISPENVRLVVNRHVSSGKKNKIHRDIRRFVPEAFAVRVSVQQKDLILEEIIDLIQKILCSLPPKLVDTLACVLASYRFSRRHVECGC